ncbi:glutaminyl-peptide cyclotransferase [Streptomyces sp. NPDC085946]|uniref:glutaminyl-peptide cyclotransferase n=1 Tax=Streptomyces sp. NPDC085946 TaxID=3365744 RepID=UPI0037D181A5
MARLAAPRPFGTSTVAVALCLGFLPGTAGTGPDQVERLRAEVHEVLPHDPRAFTQGLEVREGRLYESTGRFGESSVRSGPPGGPPSVVARLPEHWFGEGITVVGRGLWQLTWKNGVAVRRDARTLEEVRRVPYPGEGWGICYQHRRHRLVTSDGSARLTFRDPDDMTATGGVTVTLRGRPVEKLNELECVGDSVYANVFTTDRIVRIDAGTGHVTATVDASGLGRTARPDEVLNGIAALPGGSQFLLTGKRWEEMFRVSFVPAAR